MSSVFRESNRYFQITPGGNPTFPAHLHEEIELVYVKQGHGTAFCDGESYTLSAGDFFLTFPNQVHSYHNFSKDSDCIVLIAEPSFFTLRLFSFGEKTPLSPQYKSDKIDKNIIRLLTIGVEEYQQNSPLDVVASILSSMLEILLTRYAFAEVTTDSHCVSRIIRYCRDHYQEDLSVAQLSQELHLSRSHISHTFHDKLKISFPKYVNSLRLAKAVKLLRRREHTVTEVAQLAGYQTIRSFNRAFVSHFGMSPRQFLKQPPTP